MICSVCKSDLTDNERIKAIIQKKNIPFVCNECGMIKLPIRANLDRVFVWGDPTGDTIGKLGLIYLPERAKENYKNEFGTVLSVGKGYFNDRKSGAFKKTALKVGDRVVYDKTVLYRLKAKDRKNVEHEIILMGEMDVYATPNE